MSGYRWAIVLTIVQQMLLAVDLTIIHRLSGALSLLQIAFVRSVGGVVLAFCLAATIDRKAFRTHHPWLQVARAGCAVAYALLMIWSLAWMPLADATAINYLTGLYVVVLAGPILGEIMGWQRGLAVSAGLVGALMIAKPSLAAVSWFYLAAIAGTALNALGIVLTRYLRRDDSATTILLYVQLAQFAVFLPGVSALDFALWPWMAAAAIAGPLGMYCGIIALLHADASALAPYTYLRLALASGAAPVLFGEWPGIASLAGSTIIIVACVAATKEPQHWQKNLASV